LVALNISVYPGDIQVVRGAAGVAATISVGAGDAAAAPDVVGQTYRDAKNTIQESGAAMIIATSPEGRQALISQDAG
jgi:beta-lactam-binding protein with PASTA domain